MDSMEDFRERMLFFNLDRTGSRPPQTRVVLLALPDGGLCASRTCR
ncbi:hypothetical protein HPP05_09210 [Corallococcus exiguus]|nr:MULTISPECIES: hypothetical protein [Corallococcus]NNB84384.1 hypothetical protein [Corallococcus exiguus]NPC45485.1 hypothetical protein [Corallococcus exiguus]NPC69924.1 hypothetical protein [Corallococcus exiguus]